MNFLIKYRHPSVSEGKHPGGLREVKPQGCGLDLKKQVTCGHGYRHLGGEPRRTGLGTAEQHSKGTWRKPVTPEGEDKGAGYFKLLRSYCANSSHCLETSVMSDTHMLGPVEFQRMKMSLVKGHVTQKRISMCLK